MRASGVFREAVSRKERIGRPDLATPHLNRRTKFFHGLHAKLALDRLPHVLAHVPEP